MPADRAAPPTPKGAAPPRTTLRRVAILAVAILATASLYRLGTPHNFFDLKIYMSAMRWWADGNPLYDYVQADRVQGELYFTYPPFTAILLRPFAGLPLGATVTIFTIFTVLAVAVTTWWLVAPVLSRRSSGGARGSATDGAGSGTTKAGTDPGTAPVGGTGWPLGKSTGFAAAIAISLAFAVESIRETITFGQINMLLVVLILADLLFAVPRDSRWAGAGIGVATALKLFPGIFLVYLLVSRRWRAAATAAAAAAGATLLAAAFAPNDSWRFWTHEMWATDRVGRTDYTGNQSLFGMLSRFSVPDKPDRLLWLALVAIIAGYGLWRAARAARAGDDVAGLTLTGLVGALASPITWTHHVYWFIPAVVVLVDAGLRAGPGAAVVGRRRRGILLAAAIGTYACIVYGVVSFYDWGVAPEPTDSPVEFVLRNLYVLLALLLLVSLPIRRPAATNERQAAEHQTS